MEKIVLLGGGGHAKVLIDLIKTSGEYEIIGILDSQLKIDTHIFGIPVLGKDDLLPQLYKEGVNNVCIGIGSTKDNSKRKMLYEKVRQIGFLVPFLVHPKSMLSEMTEIADGAQIMAGAIIQTDSSIGQNTIINTGAIIEHDCKIGSHVHICPGATLSGGCLIGDGAFIGAGATVMQGIKMGSNAVVGAGAVVINDIMDNSTVVGVPAK